MQILLSTNKLAKYLDVTAATVRRKARNGEIPSIKVGNRLRYDKQKVDKWLLRKTVIKPRNILVIDDEPLVGQLFNDSMDESDFKVTVTLNGNEALELLKNKNRKYGLIFLDLFLPDINGVELFSRIRKLDNNIPVIIITGYPDSELMARAMEFGLVTVLKKPFNSDDIYNAIRSFYK